MLFEERHDPFDLGKEVAFEAGAVLDQGGCLETAHLDGGEAGFGGRKEQECSPRDPTIPQQLKLAQDGKRVFEDYGIARAVNPLDEGLDLFQRNVGF